MAKGTLAENFLDNPVWHALHGPASRFLDRSFTSDTSHGPASNSALDPIRFDPEVCIFGGAKYVDEAQWHRVAELVGIEGAFGFFRDAVPSPPPGWEELYRGSCLQMIAGDLPESSRPDVVELGPGDAKDMLELADLTQPGPFQLRTSELGRYVGIRRKGRLIAMAGERFRVPGFVEISAVCTHPDVRGEGLAGELTLNVARSIRSADDEAFLHVVDTNENAVRLYDGIGFRVRRNVEVVFAQWHGPGWIPTDTDS